MQKFKEENNKYTRILEGLSLALAVEEDTDYKIVLEALDLELAEKEDDFISVLGYRSILEGLKLALAGKEKAKTEKDEILKNLEEQILCPVCLLVPRTGKFTMCNKGHTTCETCKT